MAQPSSAEPHAFHWRPVHAVLVLLVAAVFLYSVRAILNPLLLFALLVFLLSPFRGTRFYVLLASASGVLALFWMLDATGSLLAPFVLALGLAYLLHPLVVRMERPWVPARFRRDGGPRLPRSAAVVLLALPALALVLLAAFVGVPALADQVSAFIRGIPALLERGTQWVMGLEGELARRDLPLVDEQALLRRLQEIRPDDVVAYLEAQRDVLAKRAWSAVLGVGRGGGALVNVLGYVFLTPILVFYLLRDWEALLGRLADLVPLRQRKAVVAFAAEYDRLLYSYVRGQLLEAAVVGVLTWLGLWLVGFPYAFLLGVVAGVFNLVPYLGLVVTAVPGIAIALFTDDVLASLLKLGVVFVVVQVLDGSVLGPRIVGGSVGLHPVWVILALALAGALFGFVGLLVAVPMAVLVKMLLALGLERYRQSGLYRGSHPLVLD
jgi:predicted PurR-regulated permease PerM